MFTNATKKFWSLVITDLADIDGFKICIQVGVWLGLRPRYCAFRDTLLQCRRSTDDQKHRIQKCVVCRCYGEDNRNSTMRSLSWD